MPGTVAAFYRQGAGGFVLAQGKPYFIDPRTPVFQAEFRRDKLRKSHRALAEIHGIRNEVERGPVDPAQLTEAQLEAMTTSVLQFQEEFSVQGTEKIDRYRKMIGRLGEGDPARPPAWIVPPYFYDDAVRGNSYAVSLRVAQMATRQIGERAHPVACVTQAVLKDDASIGFLADDYAAFPQTILHFSRFDETVASDLVLEGFWKVVEKLKSQRRPPFMLYGGYFSVLAIHAGLDGLSHGVGYGEFRNALSPKSGPTLKRFYIPALHRFFSIDDAEVLLAGDKEKRYECSCTACFEARTAGRSSLAQRSRADLLHHFLQIRHIEIQEVQVGTIPILANQLRDIHVYATTSAPAFKDDLEYLMRWAAAMESPDTTRPAANR